MIPWPILLQVSAPITPVVVPPPQSWSILTPPACPGSSPSEVVVCGGKGTPEQRLPLPGERRPRIARASPPAIPVPRSTTPAGPARREAARAWTC